MQIACRFEENESGAQFHQPELFRLFNMAIPCDTILIERVDRISRMKTDDWGKLKYLMEHKRLKVASLDLPTSYQFMNLTDKFIERMLTPLNSMMLDMIATISKKITQKIEGLLIEGKRYSQIDCPLQ
ncbi:recombinase family protein [Providencia rettgeri]